MGKQRNRAQKGDRIFSQNGKKRHIDDDFCDC